MLSNCTQYSSMLSPALTLAHTGNIAQATSSLAINKAKDDYVESLNLNAELIGIRDLFYDNQFLYISLQHKDKNGYTIGIYRAPVNYKRLEFEKFFSTNEYWDNYNVFSGGRLEKFSDNNFIDAIDCLEYFNSLPMVFRMIIHFL